MPGTPNDVREAGIAGIAGIVGAACTAEGAMRRVRTTVSTTEPSTRKRRRKSGQREDEERAGSAEMEESWRRDGVGVGGRRERTGEGVGEMALYKRLRKMCMAFSSEMQDLAILSMLNQYCLRKEGE